MLDVTWNNAWVLLTALAAGGGGGFAGGLMLFDRSQRQSPLPTGTKAGLGILVVRTLVGAVAAVAFLFFFPVQETTRVTQHGQAVVITTYPFLKIVALSIIVGAGGGAFLSAMRDRANAMIIATDAQGSATAAREVSRVALTTTPVMAGALAQQALQAAVGTTKTVASEQIAKAAAALPPELNEEQRGQLPASVANREVADIAGGLGTVAAAVDPLPARVAYQIESAVEAQLGPIVAHLEDLVPSEANGAATNGNGKHEAVRG